MFGSVREYLGVLIRECSVVFCSARECIRECSGVFGSARYSSVVFGSVWECSVVFGSVRGVFGSRAKDSGGL